MDPPNVASLPDRSKTICRTNLPTPIPTTRLSPSLSNSSSPEFQVPQIYFPDPPKLWSTERLLEGAQKERNDYIVTQWLHLRVRLEATIDDQGTEDGKLWVGALKALAKWQKGNPLLRWGRAVEQARREKGEVVIVCGLRSGHSLAAFVESEEYKDFWETLTPLLSAAPKAFYSSMSDINLDGRLSITDVFFPRNLSDAAKSEVPQLFGRNYHLQPSKLRVCHLGQSYSAWIEDDNLEWNCEGAVVRRFVSKWDSVEGEAEFKEKERVIVTGGPRLVEEKFWEDLNELGMLGSEEYHCVLSLCM